jgi:hypothetical protein
VTGWYVTLVVVLCVVVPLGAGAVLRRGDVKHAPSPDTTGSFDDATRMFSDRIPRVLDDNEVA